MHQALTAAGLGGLMAADTLAYHSAAPMDSKVTGEDGVRRLIAFALAELPSMRLDDGIYCYLVTAPRKAPSGRSLRYSEMVALGLLRARSAGYDTGVDVDELVDQVMVEAMRGPASAGDIGLAMWVAHRAGRPADDALPERLRTVLGDGGGLGALEGMEVAWIALGTTEWLAHGPDGVVSSIQRAARERLLVSNRAATGLLYHRGDGARRRYPNFATQIYGVLALARLGAEGDDEALTAAVTLADRLIAMQRDNGGWPWLYDADRGTVVEPFEVYSVHQDAMAPMAMFELAQVTGEDRFRAAAVRGLQWMDGDNELGVPLLNTEARIVHRSIRRKRPWDRGVLYLNSLSTLAGAVPGARFQGPLELNPTDRPYHLGWVLEAWAGREQLAAL